MKILKAFLIFIIFSEVVAAIGLFFVLPGNNSYNFNPAALSPAAPKEDSPSAPEDAAPAEQNNAIIPPEDAKNQLQNPPRIVKAVYATANSAGSKNFLNYLLSLVKTTEINAVVIDLKDDPGYISFETNSEKIKSYNAQKPLFNISSLVKKLHEQGIYLIARIAVFKDQALIKSRPDLAVFDNKKSTETGKVLWEDAAKMYWLDPASQEVWDYNIALAQSAIACGFDEINFDYIRFPADGEKKEAGYPFWDQITPARIIIRNFFQKIREGLPGQKLSVDLFGYSALVPDDVGIGQQLEDSFDYFDYISPMVYPSHYHPNFLGFENPADYPYEVIKYTLNQGLARQAKHNSAYSQNQFSFGNKDGFGQFSIAGAVSSGLRNWAGIKEASKLQDKIEAKFRPWLQDFDLKADYTADMVKQEIKAVSDVLGVNFAGYMLWNPANIYTEGAILKAQ